MVSRVKKKASLHTLGCRLNQSETMLIEQRLKDEGYEIVPFGEVADLGIINTCTVTNLADSKCRQSIRQFVRKNPKAYTAVVGCYSQMGFKEIAEIGGVDLIIGNQDKMSVVDFIGQGKMKGLSSYGIESARMTFRSAFLETRLSIKERI